jgi:D-sedoheptulose 7-phosphate isomerase
MDEKLFVNNYLIDLSKLVNPNNEIVEKLIDIKNKINEINKAKKKILIFGNGGSSAIASHFSVDITKNAKIRCVNFNEADLITCFANDYGYEKWIEKAVEFYGDEGDLLIIISSSGKSKNIINGCAAAKNKKFKYIVTLSGHESDNPVSKLGDVNLWVNSKAYNFIENTHQIWLLTIVDLIIGKREYPAN